LRFFDRSLDRKLAGLRRWFFADSAEHNVRWLLSPTLAIRLRRCADAQGLPVMDQAIMTVRDATFGWNVTPEVVMRTFSLTPMQAQLVHALVNGKNLDEFARAAGITKHTAKHHLGAVMPKFGVNSQTELVRKVCIFLSG
jgi:DNA-binding CsgD family transcriptional regulator